MQIKTADHGILKNNYENIFLSEWDKKKNELEKKFGVTDWEEINYMGTEAVSGSGKEVRGSKTSGGLKIVLKKKSGDAAGFIWMRGSGTEPVFRVMAILRAIQHRMKNTFSSGTGYDIKGRQHELTSSLLNIKSTTLLQTTVYCSAKQHQMVLKRRLSNEQYELLLCTQTFRIG